MVVVPHSLRAELEAKVRFGKSQEVDGLELQRPPSTSGIRAIPLEAILLLHHRRREPLQQLQVRLLVLTNRAEDKEEEEAELLLPFHLQQELQRPQVPSIQVQEEDLRVEVEFVREHQELLHLANNLLGNIQRSPCSALQGPLAISVRDRIVTVG